MSVPVNEKGDDGRIFNGSFRVGPRGWLRKTKRNGDSRSRVELRRQSEDRLGRWNCTPGSPDPDESDGTVFFFDLCLCMTYKRTECPSAKVKWRHLIIERERERRKDTKREIYETSTDFYELDTTQGERSGNVPLTWSDPTLTVSVCFTESL